MRFKKACLAVMLCAAFGPAIAAPARLHLYTESSAPTSMKEGNQGSAAAPKRSAKSWPAPAPTTPSNCCLGGAPSLLPSSMPTLACFLPRAPRTASTCSNVGPTDHAEWVLLVRDRTSTLKHWKMRVICASAPTTATRAVNTCAGAASRSTPLPTTLSTRAS
jgi:hypothetical protein